MLSSIPINLTPQTSPSDVTADADSSSKRIWKDADGNKINDEQLLKWIKEKSASREHGIEASLIVGTDSHRDHLQFRFITVVCLYTLGHGGFYYYTTAYEPREKYKKNQQQFRMFQEVTMSIEVADFIVDKTGLIPEIHIDASPKGAGEFTSAFSDSLKGYAVSAGYECRLKPDSPIANAVADRHSK